MTLFGLTALEGKPLIEVGAMAANGHGDRRRQLHHTPATYTGHRERNSDSPHPSDVLSPARLHITKGPYLLPHSATNWGSNVHTHEQWATLLIQTPTAFLGDHDGHGEYLGVIDRCPV